MGWESQTHTLINDYLLLLLWKCDLALFILENGKQVHSASVSPGGGGRGLKRNNLHWYPPSLYEFRDGITVALVAVVTF